MDIYAELTPIFRDVFDDNELTTTPGLSAKQVDGWDSLNNIRLFVAIERAFGIKFATNEVTKFVNVGELVEAIQRKRGR